MFMLWRRSNEGLKKVSCEYGYFSLSENAFSVKTHQVQHLVEGVLLPFEVIGLKLPEAVIGGRQTPPLEAKRKKVLAEGGD